MLTAHWAGVEPDYSWFTVVVLCEFDPDSAIAIGPWPSFQQDFPALSLDKALDRVGRLSAMICQ